MKLSIITLTYNKLEYTKKFIESLYKYTKDFEFIIVDNGSTDGTVEYLKTIPDIKLIENKENQGFSKGNNQGIEIAKGEYVGFLNNDILLSPNWFEACEEVFKTSANPAFVSPMQINPNFHNTDEHRYIKYFEAKKNNSYIKTFDKCEFACVITKKEILNKIGNFDTNFSPAFFEDNDFKCRAIEAGYNTYMSENACFFHFSSVTSKTLNHNFENNRKYYYEKHRFAEYLTIYADENQYLKEQIRFFEQIPFSWIYKIYLFIQKVIRNLKRIKGE